MKKIITFLTKLFANNKKEYDILPLTKLTKELKFAFRFYFEGSPDEAAIEPCLIKNFEITDFSVDYTEEETIVKITLVRPGLLIGKGGKTIDGLTKYLNKYQPNTKIHLIESKLWR